MNVNIVAERVRSYINGQITRMAMDNPVVGIHEAHNHPSNRQQCL